MIFLACLPLASIGLPSPGRGHGAMLAPMRRMFSLMVMAGLVAAVWLPAGALELDRLRMLTSAEQVPWRAVGRVNIATTAATSMCTGTLIGEDLVLTAAHCVMNPRTGKTYQPAAVHFVAGWRRGQKVGASRAAAITVHPDFAMAEQFDTEQIRADLALIRLADPIPQAKAPFFGMAPTPEPGTPLTLISYRQDRPHALTQQKGCEIIGIRDAVMTLSCNVTFGASGSPMFISSGDEMRLVAVVSAGDTDAKHPVTYAVLVDAAIPAVLAAQE
jgi:protease YdgD